MATNPVNITTQDVAVTVGGSSGGQGARTIAFQFTGTWSGTFTYEATVDGDNWSAIEAKPIAGGAVVTTSTANGIWRVVATACSAVRARFSTATSGTAVVSFNTAEGTL